MASKCLYFFTFLLLRLRIWKILFFTRKPRDPDDKIDSEPKETTPTITNLPLPFVFNPPDCKQFKTRCHTCSKSLEDDLDHIIHCYIAQNDTSSDPLSHQALIKIMEFKKKNLRKMLEQMCVHQQKEWIDSFDKKLFETVQKPNEQSASAKLPKLRRSNKVLSRFSKLKFAILHPRTKLSSVEEDSEEEEAYLVKHEIQTLNTPLITRKFPSSSPGSPDSGIEMSVEPSEPKPQIIDETPSGPPLLYNVIDNVNTETPVIESLSVIESAYLGLSILGENEEKPNVKMIVDRFERRLSSVGISRAEAINKNTILTAKPIYKKEEIKKLVEEQKIMHNTLQENEKRISAIIERLEKLMDKKKASKNKSV